MACSSRGRCKGAEEDQKVSESRTSGKIYRKAGGKEDGKRA